MDREIANFLNDNKAILKINDFYKLYDNAFTTFVLPGYSNLVGELTDTFESANINPLDYMNDIPSRYHFESMLPKNYKIGKIDTISEWAFAYASGIDTLDISSVRHVGNYAFYSSSIKTIEIPGAVKEVKPHTFSYSRLINAVISEGTTTILNEAFGSCINLTDVWLPKSLTDLSLSAFFNCNKLKNIYYNDISDNFYNLNFNYKMTQSKAINIHCTDKVIYYG